MNKVLLAVKVLELHCNCAYTFMSRSGIMQDGIG